MSVESFVAAQRTEHGVPHALSCRALDVPESTFYSTAVETGQAHALVMVATRP